MIPDIIAALDLVTSSSLSEGFSNVIGEAMACEVPCVVTDVGDSRQIVGDTGRVVPRQDPMAMAVAWHELFSLPAEARQALGKQARQRVEKLYSLEQVVLRYAKLYEQLGIAKQTNRLEKVELTTIGYN